MAGQPDVAVGGDSNRRRATPAEGDARLVQGGHTGEDGSSDGGGRGRRQRSTRKDRAEGRAFVRLHRDPDAVLIGAPGQYGRQGRVAVFVEALETGYGGCRLGRRDR